MTMPSIASPQALSISRPLSVKLPVILAIVILADWLFFDRAIGISVAFFVAALAAGVMFANPRHATPREFLIATLVLCAALLPVIEAPGVASIVFAVAGVAYFALAVTTGVPGGLQARCVATLALLVSTTYQIFADLIGACESERPRNPASELARALAVWVVPLVFTGIFAVLFASANPIIEVWLLAIDPRNWLARLNFWHVWFWLLVLVITWPFIWMRARRHLDLKLDLPALEAPDRATRRRLFGQSAIVRSLVVFNLLFAVQTGMDIAYLWRGVALPGGMSYADYAHRGAYPLMITALLAAGFIIAAMRPGGAAERSPLIRRLVFLWIGQNVVLVVSSMLRLDLYVQVYSLTCLRAAAFVWMLLVAIGLGLIVVRILLHRSNRWLVSANLAVLIATVYICSFINFPYVIASYNLEHSREMTGQGQFMDLSYLAYLGSQAIPVMDRYNAVRKTPDLPARRDKLAVEDLKRLEDWRAWNFRAWRLQRYIIAAADQQTSP